MAYKDVSNSKNTGTVRSGYNKEIDSARMARDNQRNDTNPLIEKEGFLGVDDLDRMRRRKIR